MNIGMTPQVQEATEHYPAAAKKAFKQLRKIVFDTAKENVGEQKVEETLKWGEPSYVCKTGSTIRIAWSEKTPDQIGLFFNCQTTLVETFRELYADELKFDKNRAVVMQLGQNVPEAPVQHCIATALQYHQLKHLPLLGA